jgi:hypothetical protein
VQLCMVLLANRSISSSGLCQYQTVQLSSGTRLFGTPLLGHSPGVGDAGPAGYGGGGSRRHGWGVSRLGLQPRQNQFTYEGMIDAKALEYKNK